MKFANRNNVWYKVGHNLEFEGDYNEIIHREPGRIEEDILVLAAIANLAPGASVPAAAAGVVTGQLIDNLVPKAQDIIVQVIPFVPPTEVVRTVPSSGDGSPPVAQVELISPRYSLFNPEGQLRWFNPDYSGASFIDNAFSPPDDPNEQFEFWLMNNDEPAFSVTNPDPNFTFTEAIIGFDYMIYELRQIDTKNEGEPRVYSSIPYGRTTTARFEERLKQHRF